MAVAILVPIPEWKVNGKAMSYSELWHSGVAPAMLALSLLVTLGMWGLAARHPQTRWLLVAAAIVPTLLQFCFPAAMPNTLLQAASAVLTGAVVYGYLFHSPGVKRYLRVGA